MQNVEKIDHFLQQNLNQYLDEIKRLCSQPSISATGEGVPACADLVVQVLKEHGIEGTKYETAGFPIIVGKTTGKDDHRLLFYNHYDVQPPEPLELWDSDPFTPVIKDGCLFARGARDDKGEFVSRLAAIDAITHVMGRNFCGYTFLLEGEEECGSPHLAAFVREHLDLLRAEGAFWEEGTVEIGNQPILSLGVRGILYLELSVQTMSHDAHSGHANALPNAAWRLHDALQSIRSNDGSILIPHFYDDVKAPTASDLQLFDRWPDLTPQLRQQTGVQQFNKNLSGNDLRKLVFEPTCNLSGFGSGYQGAGTKTIVPATAKAKLDFRLVPDQDPEDIYNKLRNHLDRSGYSDVRIDILGKMWPWKTPVDAPLVQLAIRAGYEVYSREVLIGPLANWSSPMYAVAGPLNMPVINPGIGYWNNCSHAPNEHIRIQDFLNGARHIARIIMGIK